MSKLDFMSDVPENEPPLSPEELALATQLDELALSLRSAARPTSLNAARHDFILEQALADPLAPPTPEEAQAAAELASALEGSADTTGFTLVRALQLAQAPVAPTLPQHERVLRRVRLTRHKLVIATLGSVSTLLAAAAALFLLLEPARAPNPRLATSRSLDAVLGAEAFNLTASERMDRIVVARAADLRENRYAAWGVR